MNLQNHVPRHGFSVSQADDAHRTAEETLASTEFCETDDRRDQLRSYSREAIRDSSGLERAIHILSHPLIELTYGHALALSNALPAGLATLEDYEELTPHIRMSLKLTDQVTKMAQLSQRLATERRVAEQTSLERTPNETPQADASENSTI